MELAPTHPDAFKYKRVPVYDLEEEDLVKHFPECFAFIDAGRESGGVLVHCAAGVSRSATVVMGWLMAQFGMAPEDARAAVKASRPVVNPNQGFTLQLKLFHAAGCSVEGWVPWSLERFLQVRGSAAPPEDVAMSATDLHGACEVSPPTLSREDSATPVSSPRCSIASCLEQEQHQQQVLTEEAAKRAAAAVTGGTGSSVEGAGAGTAAASCGGRPLPGAAGDVGAGASAGAGGSAPTGVSVGADAAIWVAAAAAAAAAASPVSATQAAPQRQPAPQQEGQWRPWLKQASAGRASTAAVDITGPGGRAQQPPLAPAAAASGWPAPASGLQPAARHTTSGVVDVSAVAGWARAWALPQPGTAPWQVQQHHHQQHEQHVQQAPPGAMGSSAALGAAAAPGPEWGWRAASGGSAGPSRSATGCIARPAAQAAAATAAGPAAAAAPAPASGSAWGVGQGTSSWSAFARGTPFGQPPAATAALDPHHRTAGTAPPPPRLMHRASSNCIPLPQPQPGAPYPGGFPPPQPPPRPPGPAELLLPRPSRYSSSTVEDVRLGNVRSADLGAGLSGRASVQAGVLELTPSSRRSGGSGAGAGSGSGSGRHSGPRRSLSDSLPDILCRLAAAPADAPAGPSGGGDTGSEEAVQGPGGVGADPRPRACGAGAADAAARGLAEVWPAGDDGAGGGGGGGAGGRVSSDSSASCGGAGGSVGGRSASDTSGKSGGSDEGGDTAGSVSAGDASLGTSPCCESFQMPCPEHVLLSGPGGGRGVHPGAAPIPPDPYSLPPGAHPPGGVLPWVLQPVLTPAGLDSTPRKSDASEGGDLPGSGGGGGGSAAAARHAAGEAGGSGAGAAEHAAAQHVIATLVLAHGDGGGGGGGGASGQGPGRQHVRMDAAIAVSQGGAAAPDGVPPLLQLLHFQQPQQPDSVDLVAAAWQPGPHPAAAKAAGGRASRLANITFAGDGGDCGDCMGGRHSGSGGNAEGPSAPRPARGREHAAGGTVQDGSAASSGGSGESPIRGPFAALVPAVGARADLIAQSPATPAAASMTLLGMPRRLFLRSRQEQPSGAAAASACRRSSSSESSTGTPIHKRVLRSLTSLLDADPSADGNAAAVGAGASEPPANSAGGTVPPDGTGAWAAEAMAAAPEGDDGAWSRSCKRRLWVASEGSAAAAGAPAAPTYADVVAAGRACGNVSGGAAAADVCEPRRHEERDPSVVRSPVRLPPAASVLVGARCGLTDGAAVTGFTGPAPLWGPRARRHSDADGGPPAAAAAWSPPPGDAADAVPEAGADELQDGPYRGDGSVSGSRTLLRSRSSSPTCAAAGAGPRFAPCTDSPLGRVSGGGGGGERPAAARVWDTWDPAPPRQDADGPGPSPLPPPRSSEWADDGDLAAGRLLHQDEALLPLTVSGEADDSDDAGSDVGIGVEHLPAAPFRWSAVLGGEAMHGAEDSAAAAAAAVAAAAAASAAQAAGRFHGTRHYSLDGSCGAGLLPVPLTAAGAAATTTTTGALLPGPPAAGSASLESMVSCGGSLGPGTAASASSSSSQLPPSCSGQARASFAAAAVAAAAAAWPAPAPAARRVAPPPGAAASHSDCPSPADRAPAHGEHWATLFAASAASAVAAAAASYSTAGTAFASAAAGAAPVGAGGRSRNTCIGVVDAQPLSAAPGGASPSQRAAGAGAGAGGVSGGSRQLGVFSAISAALPGHRTQPLPPSPQSSPLPLPLLQPWPHGLLRPAAAAAAAATSGTSGGGDGTAVGSTVPLPTWGGSRSSASLMTVPSEPTDHEPGAAQAQLPPPPPQQQQQLRAPQVSPRHQALGAARGSPRPVGEGGGGAKRADASGAGGSGSGSGFGVSQAAGDGGHDGGREDAMEGVHAARHLPTQLGQQQQQRPALAQAITAFGSVLRSGDTSPCAPGPARPHSDGAGGTSFATLSARSLLYHAAAPGASSSQGHHSPRAPPAVGDAQEGAPPSRGPPPGSGQRLSPHTFTAPSQSSAHSDGGWSGGGTEAAPRPAGRAPPRDAWAAQSQAAGAGAGAGTGGAGEGQPRPRPDPSLLKPVLGRFLLPMPGPGPVPSRIALSPSGTPRSGGGTPLPPPSPQQPQQPLGSGSTGDAPAPASPHSVAPPPRAPLRTDLWVQLPHELRPGAAAAAEAAYGGVVRLGGSGGGGGGGGSSNTASPASALFGTGVAVATPGGTPGGTPASGSPAQSPALGTTALQGWRARQGGPDTRSPSTGAAAAGAGAGAMGESLSAGPAAGTAGTPSWLLPSVRSPCKVGDSQSSSDDGMLR